MHLTKSRKTSKNIPKHSKKPADVQKCSKRAKMQKQSPKSPNIFPQPPSRRSHAAAATAAAAAAAAAADAMAAAAAAAAGNLVINKYSD